MICRRIALVAVLGFATLLLPTYSFGSSALAVGDANNSSCPNEALQGFETYLPDCRAYELVSPPFKSGLQVQSVVGLASDGTRLVGESLGAFAGAESDFRAAYYEMVRSNSGWVTSSISPPQSRFPANEFFTAAGSDPSKTGWALREPTQSIYAEDLYIRDSTGTFTKVGPMVPPAPASGPAAGEFQQFGFGSRLSYSGASDDLSHFLFTILGSGPIWPGDTTEHTPTPSLYEYVGTGNTQPALVGVSDGSTIINGETIGAGKLLSDCATFLGSTDREDEYNAISADGSTVYFTALGHNAATRCEPSERAPEVSEVYARLGHEQTVAISEPSPQDCRECNLTVKAPAEFRGASRDGTKVFFISEQELLVGAKSTSLYEYDFSDPEGEKLISVAGDAPDPRVQGVVRVSEDGSHVYFVAAGVLAGENRAHDLPGDGANNLYVFVRDAAHPNGRITFVGTLAPEDEGDWIGFDFRAAQATPDGRFLVFQSAADLTAGDSGTQQQVFEYDALTETLVRVSVGQAGYPKGSEEADTHGGLITTQNYGFAFAPAEAYKGLAVSADGSSVIFASTGALTPQTKEAALAGAQSVYEYRSSGPISDGDVYTISSGQDVLSGGELGAISDGLDATGADVFFKTADPLVSQDADTQFDIYDARADGGVEGVAEARACQGGACQGPIPSAQPPDVPSASAQLLGGESNSSSASLSQAAGPRRPASSTKTVSGRGRLAIALKTCRQMHGKHKRVRCEGHARRKYRAYAKSKPKGKR